MEIQLDRFFVSENASVDKQKNLLSIFNMFEDGLIILAPNFPLLFPQLMVSASYRVKLSGKNSSKKIVASCDIVDSKGVSILDNKPVQDVTQSTVKGAEGRRGFIFGLAPVIFPHADKYRVQLFIDKKKQKELTIEVRKG